MNSANFAITEFSETRVLGVLGRPRNLSPTQLRVPALILSPFGGCTSYYEKSKLPP
jgi:hypothetical protein